MKRKTQILDLGDYMWANQFNKYSPRVNKIKLSIFGTLFGLSLFIPFTTGPLLLALPFVRGTPKHQTLRERWFK